jgi:hypothetical protein
MYINIKSFTWRAIAYQAPGTVAVNFNVQLDKVVRLVVLATVQTSAHSSTPYALFIKKILLYMY